MFFLLLFFILYNFHSQASENKIKFDSLEYYRQFSSTDKTRLLLEAAKKNNLDRVKILIDSGASMNWSSLFDVIDENTIHDQILIVLFTRYRRYFSLDDLFYSHCISGRATFLMLFSYQGKFELVKLLVSQGDSISTTNYENHNALYYAHEKGHKEIAEFLAKANSESCCTIQ